MAARDRQRAYSSCPQRRQYQLSAFSCCHSSLFLDASIGPKIGQQCRGILVFIGPYGFQAMPVILGPASPANRVPRCPAHGLSVVEADQTLPVRTVERQRSPVRDAWPRSPAPGEPRTGPSDRFPGLRPALAHQDRAGHRANGHASYRLSDQIRIIWASVTWQVGCFLSSLPQQRPAADPTKVAATPLSDHTWRPQMPGHAGGRAGSPLTFERNNRASSKAGGNGQIRHRTSGTAGGGSALPAGAGRYVDDISLPGLCHGVTVLSPHAHARIKRVDIAKAKAAPGVLCVLTGADAVAENLGSFTAHLMPEDFGAPKGHRTFQPLLMRRQGALRRRPRRLRGRRDARPGARRRRAGRGRL